MDDELQRLPCDSFSSADPQDNNSFIRYEPSALCIVCRRDFQPENEIYEPFDAISICGDCKTVVFDDLGANVTARDINQRRRRRGRVRRESTDSMEDLFLQEFSQLINLVRLNRGDQYDGGNVLNTPSGGFSSSQNRSMRWRRVFSDNESDGHDYMDSLFGESESNFSFRSYGGESDVSMDRHSLLDQEMSIQFDDDSHINTDTDIDPMHAGLDPWNSDDQDGGDDDDDDDADDGEWGEADMHGELSRQVYQDGQIQEVSRSPVVNRARIRRRWREERLLHYPNMFSDLEEPEMSPYGRPGDYLDQQGFEELLQHLVETDDTRRGAPPAAVSFVENLPCVVISKFHEKNSTLICAICKDPLPEGTKAASLPCSHVYHTSCILPWLASRNSCPVCRYEVPTDDCDYERGKRNLSGRMESQETLHQEHAEESSSSTSGDYELHEPHNFNDERSLYLDSNREVDSGHNSVNRGSRGPGWLFTAAAPIVSLMGVALILWLGKPLVEGTRRHGIWVSDNQQPQGIPTNPTPVGNDGRNRRWYSFV